MATSDVGERIRVARETKGWTQTDLAERLGTTKKTVGTWERTGNVPPLKLTNILRELGLVQHTHRVPSLTAEAAPAQLTADPAHMVVMETMTISRDELAAMRTPLGQLKRIRSQLLELASQTDRVIAELEDQG